MKKDTKSENVIEIKGLTKKYGSLTAVKNLDLNVHRGEVFGFLGPNGAGKTTTIRVLMDQIHLQHGTYSLLGVKKKDITPQLYRRIGYLSGEAYLFDNYTPRKLFKYFSELNGTGTGEYLPLSERFKLDLDKNIRELSSGNRQKVALIQALMNKPELLILDEPTTGLDPLLQKEFEKVIEENVNDGVTVFLSSHIMSEVEKVCDRVGIIRKGELVKVATIRELHTEMELYRVGLFSKERAKIMNFKKKFNVSDFTQNGDSYQFVFRGDANLLLNELVKVDLEDLSITEPSLEELFLKYYDNDSE